MKAETLFWSRPSRPSSWVARRLKILYFCLLKIRELGSEGLDPSDNRPQERTLFVTVHQRPRPHTPRIGLVLYALARPNHNQYDS